MISVTEKDRDVLRFLWFNDLTKDDPDMIELRFARVVFGVSSSPFLLNATIKHHLEKFLASHPETVTSILHSIYVDDVVFGAEDEEGAYKLYHESKEIMQEGSFNLRKYTTSCPSLQARIDQEEGLDATTRSSDSLETFAKTTLGGNPPEKGSEQKILGVSWNTHSDSLVFDVRELVERAVKLEPTKRNIISMIGRFYDPLGAVSPVIIKFKILMQEICESQVEWDQPLEESLVKKWLQLVTDLKQAQPFSIPRYYFKSTTDIESACLYGFCDASEKAYAGVIYLAIQSSAGASVQFVVSKTRVAPIRSQTIPRLELLSALLLARLLSTVTTALSPLMKLGPPRCYIWKKQFGLFIDLHGIWRCGGRLGEADLSYSSKHPALLCRDQPLTTLIIRNAHERVGHNGVRDTLTEIRSKYWIVKGRRNVQAVIARCVVCRRFEGKSFTAPLPPPLPKFRVQEARPFAHTAIDFAGPLHVKTFGLGWVGVVA